MDLAEAPNKVMTQNFVHQSAGRGHFQKAENAVGGTGCFGRCQSLSRVCSGNQGKLGPNQTAQIQKMN